MQQLWDAFSKILTGTRQWIMMKLSQQHCNVECGRRQRPHPDPFFIQHTLLDMHLSSLSLFLSCIYALRQQPKSPQKFHTDLRPARLSIPTENSGVVGQLPHLPPFANPQPFHPLFILHLPPHVLSPSFANSAAPPCRRLFLLIGGGGGGGERRLLLGAQL